MPRLIRCSALLLILITIATAAAAQPADKTRRVESPWAGPDLVTNPVAFCIDPFGNIYIAETDRAGNAVTDTRGLGHLNAIEEDLRLQTVEDRRALIRKWVAGGHFEADFFTRHEDRVAVVRDTDGDGTGDTRLVFSGGYNDEVDGIASGVLWHDGSIFFTNIPHLWKLRDTDGDFLADQKESLSEGYGIRWCFYGHDMHGLVLGPDGRIYFSMGDRGFNVTTKEGVHLFGPERGGVFRCWPDGTGLELFYEGLRNPQELCFDEFGNFFTGDNNCDSGDKARVHQIVEGGDSGWRQDVQSLPSRGPWNREKMWELGWNGKDATRPAWQIPPIAHIGAGPSGIAYYPGLGESPALNDHILMVDFYGSGSTVHAFQMVPDGAWHTLEDHHQFYKGRPVTDIAFGYDGRTYLSDWGEGWGPNTKSNIFTLTNATVHDDPSEHAQIVALEQLFRNGFKATQDDALLDLLAHRDQRVRIASQYELASRPAPPTARLVEFALRPSAPLLQRVHAIWTLGMLARVDKAIVGQLTPLLDDRDAQIRTQAVRTLGDLRAPVASKLILLLSDPDARVHAEAALALGKLAHRPAIRPLLELLARNDDRDPVVRHSASFALSRIGNSDELVDAAQDAAQSPSPSARLGAVIALRRMNSDAATAFLRDESPQVAIEAIRAVYDNASKTGMPALASRLNEPLPDALRTEPVMRRLIAACARLGRPQDAMTLARFAARDDFGSSELDQQWRLLALQALDQWEKPLLREGVWGHLVDLPARPTLDVQTAIMQHIDAIVARASSDESIALAQSLQTRYALKLSVEQMRDIVMNTEATASYRALILNALASQHEDQAVGLAREVLQGIGSPSQLRIRAMSVVAERSTNDSPTDLELVRTIAESDAPVVERQHAVSLLGQHDRAGLTPLIQRLRDGDADASIALDIFLAAGNSSLLKDWNPDHDRPPGFASLFLTEGGDASRGEQLFRFHDGAQCLRCHMVNGTGGTAGPDLSIIGAAMKPAGLVTSIVEPSAKVARGYGTVAITLTGGSFTTGTLIEEHEREIIIEKSGQRQTIQRSSIRDITGPTSAMPLMTEKLKPHEVRDIVAYLGTLQGSAANVASTDPSHSNPSVPRHIRTIGLIVVSWLVLIVISRVLLRVDGQIA